MTDTKPQRTPPEQVAHDVYFARMSLLNAMGEMLVHGWSGHSGPLARALAELSAFDATAFGAQAEPLPGDAWQTLRTATVQTSPPETPQD